MSLTPAEREDLIAATAERVLLLLPGVVGTLMASKASMARLRTDFYAEHPELKDHRVAVASVIEWVEGQHPGMKFEEVLKTALPLIKARIAETEGLDTTTLNRHPERHLPALVDKGNGESSHGVL